MGHDIGCHTFSHYRLDQGSAEEMERDAVRNIRALEQILDGKRIEHFSYPFGQISFQAKRLLSGHYKTMRSSRPGINLARSDLYLLRAASIYAPSFDIEAIDSLIKRTVRRGGWLIFYTHGVDENPDSYSCTPEQLNRVIDRSKVSGARILPVSDAFETINQA
jgi:peptidoglycan/xylan/chitin deacetylase (PgdA/CDA1 family)